MGDAALIISTLKGRPSGETQRRSTEGVLPSVSATV